MVSLPRNVRAPPRPPVKLSVPSTKSARVPKFTASTKSTPPPASQPVPEVRYRLSPSKVLLYADRSLVVINKPSGLISQLSDPSNARSEPNANSEILSTLLDDLRDTLELQQRPRPLHRLDKACHTTGALAFACTKESAQSYSKQLASGELKKTYLALICGDLSSHPQKKGIIKTDLECREGWVRIPGAEGVYEAGREGYTSRGENWTKPAITEYEVLASSPKVPMSLFLHCPVLGDHLYQSPKSGALRKARHHVKIQPGLYLHASQMTSTRYRPGRFELTIGCPLPEKFTLLCKKAGIPLTLEQRMGGVWVNEEKVRGPEITYPAVSGDGEELHEPDTIEAMGGKWYGLSYLQKKSMADRQPEDGKESSDA